MIYSDKFTIVDDVHRRRDKIRSRNRKPAAIVFNKSGWHQFQRDVGFFETQQMKETPAMFLGMLLFVDADDFESSPKVRVLEEAQ